AHRRLNLGEVDRPATAVEDRSSPDHPPRSGGFRKGSPEVTRREGLASGDTRRGGSVASPYDRSPCDRSPSEPPPAEPDQISGYQKSINTNYFWIYTDYRGYRLSCCA